MDREDREEIEKIIRDSKIAHEIFTSKSPKVYKSFLELEQKTSSDGTLKKKFKELMAIARVPEAPQSYSVGSQYKF